MSKSFSLDVQDLLKLAKNAGLVGLAAGLTYFGANLADVDMGVGLVAFVPVLSTLLDSAITFVKDNTDKKEDE